MRPSNAQTPPPPTNLGLNHFYLHGFTGNSGTVYDMSQWTNAKFSPTWGSSPELYSYNCFNSIANDAFNAGMSFNTAHSGDYIGLGYSAGGLVTRRYAQNSATPLTGGGYSNSTVLGFITVDSPNNGARIAAHWQEWAVNSALAECKVGRGEFSFLASGGYVLIAKLAPLLLGMLSAVQALWPMATDLKPSSTEIESLNSSDGIARESGCSRGWVAIYGTIWPSTYHHLWRQTAFLADGDENHINQAMDDYQAKIDDAMSQSHWHDNHADHLHGFWNAFARAWHRTRAGDWHACADGWKDLDDAWEWATAERKYSDGFIAQSSQIFNAPVAIRISGNMNHKGAILAGTPGTGGLVDPSGTKASEAVWHAMNDALVLTHR